MCKIAPLLSLYKILNNYYRYQITHEGSRDIKQRKLNRTNIHTHTHRDTDTHIYIYVMLSVVGNWEQRSNQDGAVCISHSANTLGKNMNPTMGK